MKLLTDLIRACRLPFLTASVIPFTAGSFIAKDAFSPGRFCLGILAVAMTHIGANLINDYADSRSGADWKDKRFFGFFGGSKLIQEGVFSEAFYLRASMICYATAFLAVTCVAAVMKAPSALWICVAVLILSLSYSVQPLQLSYRKLGEVVVFMLFGPVLLCGGYFIQTGRPPTVDVFLLSLPFAFLVTVILLANEIADAEQDRLSGKRNLASSLGANKAYIVYWLLNLYAAASIIGNIAIGTLGTLAWVSLLYLYCAVKAGRIIRDHHTDRSRLVESSKLVILAHLFVSVVLTVDIIL